MKSWLLMGIIFVCVGCNSSDQTLKIAATSVPHSDLLQVIKKDLKNEGVELKIIEVADYNLPNIMLHEKQVDANFFQHKPFLDEQIRLHGYEIVPLTAVHIEPLGIYSDNYKSLDEVRNKSIVAIPQDPTNEARALILLQDVGLIKLQQVDNQYLITPLDIVENPKHLRFEELDAPYLPRALLDVDLAVIPGNFALQAKLDPLKEALALESKDSPYANIVAIHKDGADRDEFKKLRRVLNSDNLLRYINEHYAGSVIPAF